MASKQQSAQTTKTDHNLPDHLSPFVGRQQEVAVILELLANAACRLLTLIGPGGIGKTRLATQAGSQLLPDFSHGIYFVSLRALESPDLLLSTIADTLKFPLTDRQNPHLQLTNYLGDKQMLLILDNVEHLLAAGPQLTNLLQATTGLKLLVTSREALNLQEEWLYQVEGLPYPTEREPEALETFDAVQLFERVARRVRPDFALAEVQSLLATPFADASPLEEPVVDDAPSPQPDALIEPLTEREVEVLQLMAAGLTNPEIAERLIIATGTVKYYTGQIYGKLGVRNRVEAVARGRELGLIEV